MVNYYSFPAIKSSHLNKLDRLKLTIETHASNCFECEIGRYKKGCLFVFIARVVYDMRFTEIAPYLDMSDNTCRAYFCHFKEVRKNDVKSHNLYISIVKKLANLN